MNNVLIKKEKQVQAFVSWFGQAIVLTFVGQCPRFSSPISTNYKRYSEVTTLLINEPGCIYFLKIEFDHIVFFNLELVLNYHFETSLK